MSDPAYPTSHGHNGVSRREYFAGIALSRMTLSVPCVKGGYLDEIAKACYEYADAMIRAADRKKYD